MRAGRSRMRSRVAWNKGQRMPELTKRKISLAQKRRHADAPALRAGVRAKLQVRAESALDKRRGPPRHPRHLVYCMAGLCSAHLAPGAG